MAPAALDLANAQHTTVTGQHPTAPPTTRLTKEARPLDKRPSDDTLIENRDHQPQHPETIHTLPGSAAPHTAESPQPDSAPTTGSAPTAGSAVSGGDPAAGTRATVGGAVSGGGTVGGGATAFGGPGRFARAADLAPVPRHTGRGSGDAHRSRRAHDRKARDEVRDVVPRWATGDPCRRFDGLFDLVTDPASLEAVTEAGALLGQLGR